MSNKPISKVDYLKRYLSKEDSGPPDSSQDVEAIKKKKKKKKKLKGSTVKIIDNDVFLGGSEVKENLDEEDIDEKTALRLGRGEELPSVAGIVDSRPMDVIIKEKLSTGEWKPLEGWNEENAPLGMLNGIKEEPLTPSQSPARRRRHDSSEEDEQVSKKSRSRWEPQPKARKRSPQAKRRRRHDSSDEDHVPRRRHDSSDASPPRRTSVKREPLDPPMRVKQEQDSDASPPRRRDEDSDASPPRMNVKREACDSDASPPRREGNLPSKTLDGKKAGLQDGKTLKREMNEMRAREKDTFSKLSNDVSGRGAETKIRGRLKEKEELKKQKKKEHEITDEVKKKYTRWSKGLKQLEQNETRLQEDLHEMDKPLARSKDDKDLDEYLRNIERDDDPMLKYIKKKKVKKVKTSGGPRYPTYQGPQPFPNRFGIPPGYRWDGVDRSTGFEKQLVESANKKKAVAEEALKWSQEDM